jgi:hypothetical protein
VALVAARLGVQAEWVIFGHVHRLGPLPGDQPARWRARGGGPRVANTGSWTYEPLLVHRAAAWHPYWPGGALVIEGEGDPVAVNLLEGCSPAEIHVA